MAKIKTLIASHYATGGSLLYFQKIADALRQLGYPAVFYLPAGLKPDINRKSRLRNVLKEPSSSPALLRIRALKYAFHMMKYLYNAIAINPDKDITIAHLLFPFYLTDIITVRRLRRRGIRVILSIHELFPHKPFLGGSIDRRIIRSLYRQADVLLVHAESLKKDLAENFPDLTENIRVVPHGWFDPEFSPLDKDNLRARYTITGNRKILLFFGGVRQNKGLDILLDAMQELKDEYFLLIAGKVPGASETAADHYRKKIAVNGLQDAVQWIERYIPDDIIPEIFKISDALVLPYRKNFHAQSGVLNLAIGYEKPCVVTDVGGLGEIVRTYRLGIVVEPENALSLVSGIRRLGVDKAGYGFDHYKKDNHWVDIARKIIAIYKNP